MNQQITSDEIGTLIRESLLAKKFSYAPYSKFRVGAALLDRSGRIWTGCNVENCSYPAGICAERTAVVKAISSSLDLAPNNNQENGESNDAFRAVAISSDLEGGKCIYPCGICRQVLAEFGLDLIVIATKNSSAIKNSSESKEVIFEEGKDYEMFSLREMLPKAFTPADLLS